MKRIKPLFILSLCFSFILAAVPVNAAYAPFGLGMGLNRLILRVTTNSNWAFVEVGGSPNVHFLNQVLEGRDLPGFYTANESDSMGVGYEGRAARVVVDFELFVEESDAEALDFVVSKDKSGFVKLEVFNANHNALVLIDSLNFTQDEKVESKPLSIVIDQDAIEIPRKNKVPREVFAFYYPWYGLPDGLAQSWANWSKDGLNNVATHMPLGGFYDSARPELMEKHIQEARRAGIDGFICSWQGQRSYEDLTFRLLLDVAGRQNYKLSIYYETADNRDQVVRDLVYLFAQYGPHPAFQKIDGSPVVFISELQTIQLAPEDWQYIYKQLQLQNVRLSLIGGRFDLGYVYDQFQGVHSYNEAFTELKEVRVRYKVASYKARLKRMLFAATVMPGFDNSAVAEDPEVHPREGGKYYRDIWQTAIASEPDWILISTFNRWDEGTEIEPSHEFGPQYLDLTAQFAHQWKDVTQQES